MFHISNILNFNGLAKGFSSLYVQLEIRVNFKALFMNQTHRCYSLSFIFVSHCCHSLSFIVVIHYHSLLSFIIINCCHSFDSNFYFRALRLLVSNKIQDVAPLAESEFWRSLRSNFLEPKAECSQVSQVNSLNSSKFDVEGCFR